jgi:mevalonate kinase
MRENHKLLSTIGVVPEKVQSFIATIEEIGGAAKISGAGSVRGSSGGTLVAIADTRIEALCKRFEYQIFPLEGEVLGATVHRS